MVTLKAVHEHKVGHEVDELLLEQLLTGNEDESSGHNWWSSAMGVFSGGFEAVKGVGETMTAQVSKTSRRSIDALIEGPGFTDSSSSIAVSPHKKPSHHLQVLINVLGPLLQQEAAVAHLAKDGKPGGGGSMGQGSYQYDAANSQLNVEGEGVTNEQTSWRGVTGRLQPSEGVLRTRNHIYYALQAIT